MAAENVGFFLLEFLVWPISTTMPKIRLGPKCVSQADLRCRTIIEGKPLPLQKTNNKQPHPPPKKKQKKQKKNTIESAANNMAKSLGETRARSFIYNGKSSGPKFETFERHIVL